MAHWSSSLLRMSRNAQPDRIISCMHQIRRFPIHKLNTVVFINIYHDIPHSEYMKYPILLRKIPPSAKLLATFLLNKARKRFITKEVFVLLNDNNLFQKQSPTNKFSRTIKNNETSI